MAYNVTLSCSGMPAERIQMIKDEIDPEDRLTYFFGQDIIAKNPTKATIAAMCAAGIKHDLVPVGDDGERYLIDAGKLRRSDERGSLFHRLRVWLRRISYRHGRRVANGFGFTVGDRVVDLWGNQATVTEIRDRDRNGMGLLIYRYDDGRKSQEIPLGNSAFRKL